MVAVDANEAVRTVKSILNGPLWFQVERVEPVFSANYGRQTELLEELEKLECEWCDQCSGNDCISDAEFDEGIDAIVKTRNATLDLE